MTHWTRSTQKNRKPLCALRYALCKFFGNLNLQPQASNLRIGDAVIEIDPRYFRPLEVEFLQGDASKAKKKLGWEPKIKFKELVKIMVDADIKNLEKMKQCQEVIRRLSTANSKQ